jgi:hypothetical protein
LPALAYPCVFNIFFPVAVLCRYYEASRPPWTLRTFLPTAICWMTGSRSQPSTEVAGIKKAAKHYGRATWRLVNCEVCILLVYVHRCEAYTEKARDALIVYLDTEKAACFG